MTTIVISIQDLVIELDFLGRRRQGMLQLPPEDLEPFGPGLEHGLHLVD
jgi:hypothetical protein